MDLAKLDLRAASERGSWVHLSYKDKPLFLDDTEDDPKKPQRIKVRGLGADPVIQAYHRVEREQALRAERMARASADEAEGVIERFQADLQDAMAALIVSAVSEWENIVWDGKPLKLNDENVLKICGPNTLFFAQVNKTISEEHRLFTEADSA